MTDEFGGVAIEDTPPATDEFGGVAVDTLSRDEFGGIEIQDRTSSGPYKPGAYKGEPQRDSQKVELRNDIVPPPLKYSEPPISSADLKGPKPRIKGDTFTPLTTEAFDRGYEDANAKPSVAEKLMGSTAKFAGAVGGDVLNLPAAAAGYTKVGENLASGSDDEPLPVDRRLSDYSRENPKVGTAGKIGLDLIKMAPLMAMGGLPAWMQKLGAGYFTVDMIQHSGEPSRMLGEQMALPPEERDMDQLTTAVAGLATVAVFAPMAGKHAVFDTVQSTVSPNDFVVRKLSEQLKNEPLALPPEPGTPLEPFAIRDTDKVVTSEKQALVETLEVSDAPLTAEAVKNLPEPIPAVEKPVEVKETPAESKAPVEPVGNEIEAAYAEREALLKEMTVPPSSGTTAGVPKVGDVWYRGHVEGQPLGQTETFIANNKEQAGKFSSQVGGIVTEVRFKREPKIYPVEIPWDEYQQHWRNSVLLKGYDAVRVIEPNGQSTSLAIRNPDVLDVSPPQPSQATPSSASAPGLDVPIGARKSMTAELRDAVGLGVLPDNAGYTLPDIWNEVTQARTANSLAPAQLAQSVIANPRMLEPVEVGLLTARLVELKNSMNKLAADGDFQGVGNVFKEMDALTGAMKISGGKASKGLNAFRLISKEDFTLDTMLMRERSSKGRELTDTEMQGVASMAKEIETKQIELDKESAIAEEQSQVEAAERAVAEMAGQLRGARQTKFKGFDQGTRGADVLDKLEGITNTIDPKLIKEHNPNWKPHKDLKKLFREGGMKADEAISGLGLDVKAGELGEILNAAARARRGNKTAARNEARLAKQEDRAAVLDSKIASVQAMIAAEKAKIFGKPVAITAGPTGVEAALSKIPNIISWIKIGAGHVNILRLKGQRGFDAWQAEMIATYPGNGLDSNLNAIYRASLKEARKQARELKSGVLDLSPAERRANTLKQAKETMAEEGFDKTVDLGRYAKQLAKQHISEGITKMGDVVEAVHADLLNIVPDFTRSETMDAISDYGKVRALDNNLVNKRARQLRTEIQMTRKLSDALAGEMPKKTGQQREPSTVLTRQLQKQLKDVMAEQGMNQKDPSKQLASALDAKKNAIRNRIAEIKDELASGKRLVRTNKGEIKLDAEGEVLQAELDGLKKQRETIFGKDEKKPLTDEQKLERATDAAEKELQKWTKRAMEAGLTGKEFTKTSKTTISSPEIKALKAQAEAAKAEYEELSGLKARLEGEKRASSLERERETIQKDIDRRLAGTESVGGKVNRPHDNPEIEGLLQVKDSVMERIAAEKKAEREAAKPSVEEMYVRRRLTALTRAEADYASRIARGDFESPRPKKAKPSLTEAQRNVVDDKAIEVERLKSEWRKRQAQNVLDNLKGGELFVDQMKEVSNLHRNLNSSFDWSAPRQASGALMSAIGDVPFAVVRAVTGRGALMDSPIANFARSMAKGYRATWSEQKFERYRKRYEARENYRNGLEEQAGLNRRGIETDENTRGRWSNSKLLKPILRPWNRAFETMLNENSAATFDAIVSTLADRSPESLKKVARLVNDLHGTGYVPGKFRAGVELAAYVLWSPKLLIANIRNTLMAEAWGSGGPKEARKIARQYYAKMIMGAFAIQQLGKLAGYENDDKGRLLDGDTHIDPYGGHLQVINQEWMQLYDLLRYGPDEVGEATLDTLDIPEPKAPRMGDFEYFTYTKMHPSARLVYEMARKHGKNFDGSDKTVLGTVEDFLPMGGRPSDIMKLLEEHGIPKGIALQAAQMHGASVNIYQENERPKR